MLGEDAFERLVSLDLGDLIGAEGAALRSKRGEISLRVDAFVDRPGAGSGGLGQGALGIEIRDGDKPTRKALQPLHDAGSAIAVTAERALLAALGGGCQAPVAAWVDGNRLYGRVTERDGASQLTASADIAHATPQRAGEAVARLLEAEGAGTLLAR